MQLAHWTPWHRNGLTAPIRLNRSPLLGTAPSLFYDLLGGLNPAEGPPSADLRPRADLAETDEKSDDYHHVERSFGSFKRAFRLPLKVNEADIAAVFTNGLLTVRLPKAPEPADSNRRIEVTTAD